MKLNPDQIINTVAWWYGVTIEEIKSPRRPDSILPARYSCYTLLYERGLSYKKVGSIIGGRDHSTVLDGIKRFEEWRDQDDCVRKDYEGLLFWVG